MINKSKLFSRAWEIAKNTAKEIGEKAVKFFSGALKMAWEEIKIENAPLKPYELKIKEWLYNKIEEESSKYWTWISYSRRTNDIFNTGLVVDGYVFVIVREFLEETEKAIKVVLDTREVGVGSAKGWTTWLPKSQIIRAVA